MKQILIVDDDVITNNSIKTILSNNYHVYQLTRGAQVMDFLHMKKTDLILLDVYMQDVSGLDLIKAIKEDPETSAIPVIFLTGDDSKEAEEHCYELGAADFITKPIHRRTLEQSVENHLMAYESYERVRQMYKNSNSEDDSAITTDELTGLGNRNHIFNAYSAIMSSSQGQCAIAFIDIDNFKSINEIFGKTEGDALLKRFAKELKELDKLGVIAGRIGGDDFALIIPGQANPATIQSISDYLFENSSKKLLPQSDPGSVTFSMGVAFAPEDGDDFESAATLADMALRRAKMLGKNRVYFARNLKIRTKQKDSDAVSSMASLKRLMEARSSDKGAMNIQFGEMRILYLTMQRLSEDMVNKVSLVMFTINPEDCNPFDSGRLMHALCDKDSGITVVTRYSQNQFIAMVYSDDKENLLSKYTKMVENEKYGRITIEII